jgi:hypothetical protein
MFAGESVENVESKTIDKKVALCFIIRNKIVKENLWREWIEYNKDFINVYFHIKNYSKTESTWIKQFCIPNGYIVNTSYYHIVPAYINLMKFALVDDLNNSWFCFVTDSCVPLFSPFYFRKMFLEHKDKSILKWKPAWWNTYYHRRANLYLFNKDYHLVNDPYFILCREDTEKCIKYSIFNSKIYNKICSGIIANESIFAIILKVVNSFKNVINESSHLTKWEEMSSVTSPYVFKSGSQREIEYIITNKTPFTFFIRKVDESFPDEIIKQYCWNTYK